jgi:lysophospholipase L1-like esterase
MRRRLPALACALAVLAALPATAESAAKRRVFVNGDSLAVGTRPYLPGDLRGWRVTQSASISRHAPEGPPILRGFGRGLPRVIVMSLGTNDDPRQVGTFRQAIRDTMSIAGERRCVVWVNIVRPPVAGTSYAGYNHALAEESRPRANLRVVNWAHIARANPGWFGEDGVHVTAEGYQARAKVIAKSVKRCK